MIKGGPLGWDKRTLDSNSKLYTEIKTTEKGNNIGKYRNWYYYAWFITPPFSYMI